MHETTNDVVWLQALLDRSYEKAGEHLRSITTPERRISAADLIPLLDGVQIIDLATVNRDGRPRVGPVDGLFFRSRWYFSSARSSLRHRNLLARPHVSAAHTRGEQMSVVVHGTAHLFTLDDPKQRAFKDYAHEVYVPRYGDAWIELAYSKDVFFARIEPDAMFTLRIDEPQLS
jgi:nitroimidazol reductase NimA-like FMN-containing flavoprotein (pyridoxamine 5'-phosphate oxidase superfamily)